MQTGSIKSSQFFFGVEDCSWVFPICYDVFQCTECISSGRDEKQLVLKLPKLEGWSPQATSSQRPSTRCCAARAPASAPSVPQLPASHTPLGGTWPLRLAEKLPCGAVDESDCGLWEATSPLRQGLGPGSTSQPPWSLRASEGPEADTWTRIVLESEGAEGLWKQMMTLCPLLCLSAHPSLSGSLLFPISLSFPFSLFLFQTDTGLKHTYKCSLLVTPNTLLRNLQSCISIENDTQNTSTSFVHIIQRP